MTAQLLQGDGTLLAEMDVSTDGAGHRTPKGNFQVTEKMPYKRSNLYGQYVKKDTREVVVARHWEHKGPKPAGTVYQGIAMPYWMRQTADHTASLQPLAYHQRVKVRTIVDGSLDSLLFDDQASLDIIQNGF